ncbi:MAG: NAD-dependent epimerase/dehydratase family protein [Peptoanaerobacter stomatis]|uniref:NAD-dependent epimerase/dehydratase family protein n=1 Tax=Peptoanaerobacter stomatis TaxID=796937 RepID=UPI003F9F3AEC
MKIIILGGTGLLSASITKMCIAEGKEVLHFNRRNRRPAYDVQTIQGNRYYKGDLEKILNYRPDVVIDMLCFSEKDAELTVDVFANKIEHYVYCSTSCVYTPRISQDWSTEESETKPLTKYGQGKLQAERVFLEAMDKGLFNITIFRPGHIFGRDFLVNNLSFDGIYVLNRLLNNKPVVLTENGERNFQACHVDNVGLAFAKASGLKNTYGKVYNLSGEEEFTWNDIYLIEKELLNSNSQIIYKGTNQILSIDPIYFDFLKTYTKFDWKQSTKKLNSEIIGYSYNIGFETGLIKFISDNEEKIYLCENEKCLYEKILND